MDYSPFGGLHATINDGVGKYYVDPFDLSANEYKTYSHSEFLKNQESIGSRSSTCQVRKKDSANDFQKSADTVKNLDDESYAWKNLVKRQYTIAVSTTED